MKSISTLFFSLALAVSATAQTAQTVALSYGTGYNQDVWYSCATGQVKTEPAANWDLAFTVNLWDASILINEVKGVELYEVSSDINDWSTLDTTGALTTPLHNSDLAWEGGAFVSTATGHPDYGWGTYNQVTHAVTGSKIFVLKLADGTYRKMIIDEMAPSGQYTFRIANLDGTNELTKTANKTSYTGKNFFYYDVTGDLFLDREPLSSDWDLVFRRYFSVVQTQWYPVSGVQSNIGVATSEARGIDTTLVDWNNHPVSDTNISEIGSDWKMFDMSTFTYVVDDSLSYFVAAQDGNLYKIVFKSFDGSSTGNFTFSQTLASGLSVEEPVANQNIRLFPNPATDFVNLEGLNSGTEVRLLNLNGQEIFRTQSEGEAVMLNLSGITPGLYLLQAGNAVSKLVVN